MKLLLTTIAAVLLVGCGPPKAPDISIHDAAYNGYIEAVKQHIAAGTDVNTKSKKGVTPLLWAVGEGRNQIAELLIAKGADVNAKDNRGGATPLDYANAIQKYDSPEVEATIKETADLIRKHGGKRGKELK
jgi:hypothetical protein